MIAALPLNSAALTSSLRLRDVAPAVFDPLASAPNYSMTQAGAASSPKIPTPLLIGGAAVVGVAVLAFAVKKLKKKR